MWVISDFEYQNVGRARYLKIKHGVLWTRFKFLDDWDIWAPGTWAYINHTTSE